MIGRWIVISDEIGNVRLTCHDSAGMAHAKRVAEKLANRSGDLIAIHEIAGVMPEIGSTISMSSGSHTIVFPDDMAGMVSW